MPAFLRVVCLLALLPFVHVTAHAAGTAPADTVERLHATLLDTMQQADTLGYPGRVAKLSPELQELFDFPTIARLVTGRHWPKIPDASKEKFIDVFARLSAATYADNFKSFGGERFETRSTEDKKSAQLVKTALVKPDGKEVSLNYLLARKDDLWRIVNVVADGVSDLSLKRAEYTAVIGSEGIDALIAKLEAKVASYGR
ncbi:MAG: ABC transporter substrate-binding protein [Gammaproteobacteria bacterium]